MAHYKDQFKLPPKPFDISLDVMIKMMNHCYNLSNVAMVNSAFSLIKLSGGHIEMIGGKVTISKGLCEIDKDDMSKAIYVIRNNYKTAKSILERPNIFNGG